ncbi:SCO7613 C-terminal domain-containing membrane protein [Blastococcus deserti]|uniref:SCO7613 C-terminal domain-containing membrane protein n=1 Tax=Blastococcus deserti TaxID=2259033 RepID=A0ABW4XFN9_9ACTN
MAGPARTTTPVPPLPYRARPPQVVLVVGAVLVVTAAATLARVHAGALAQLLLLTAAGALAALSLGGSGVRLRSSAETLAAAAATLGLAAALADGPATPGDPVTSLVLAGAFLGLHVVAPDTVTWPLASWAALQLGTLRLLDVLPGGVATEVQLGVALVGLGVALSARRFVARVVLVTTAPWWVVGVVSGSADAWAGGQGSRWFAAVLMVAAGAGLVAARLRRELEPLLGPRELAPVVAGVVSGAAVTGALSPNGTGALVAAGWTGVAVASLAAVFLTGWRRGLLLPAAVAGGTTTTALCVGQLVQDRAWGALSLLLLLVALPPAGVALLRRSTRHVTVPVSVWCLSGSVLLALPADLATAPGAGILLAAVYAAAMALGSGLEADVRRPTARAAAGTGAIAVLLPAVAGDRGGLLVVLLVQGLATLAWAVRTRRRTGADVVAAPHDPVAEEISRGWRVGAAHLVVAGWTGVALVDLRLLEGWTLPLAVGLLVAAGPHLVRDRSWPSWGPGLLVALAPSTVWGVVEPDGWRSVWVLSLAVVALVAGSTKGVLAPLVVGAGTAVVLVLGLAVPALPWPLTAALLVGAGLLALGTLREWRPVAGFRLRLAQLR